MFLHRARQQLQTKALRTPFSSTALHAASAASTNQFQMRPYFSVFEKVKDRFRAPIKHIE